VFNIFSHQGNVNQNYIEIPSYPSHNGCYQGNKAKKVSEDICVCVCVRRIPVHYWWECKLVPLLRKSVWSFFFKKLKIELPYDGAIPLLGIYPEESKSACNTDTCIPTYIVALFAIAELWIQPRYLSMDECIKKNIYIYTHSGVLFAPREEEQSH
jgi:hypothetical protein